MDIVYRKLKDIKPNPMNPREGSPERVKELAASIKANPDYFEARPILLSDRTGELVIVGGERRSEAAKYLGLEEVPTILISGLTEEREKELIIRDNTHTGVWDSERLKEWDVKDLQDWGVNSDEFPSEKKIKETERLSDIKFKGIYYEPDEKPSLSLVECVDFDKFEAKIKVIEDSPLSDEAKEVMRWFAYRFLKIDFERVADYYAFNATEDEKEVMQRLRLVLVDDGSVDGFIEDDILRINEVAINDEDDA